jgi:cyclopropane fatty-acyl-phospholipid synthase-like methyltransferase
VSTAARDDRRFADLTFDDFRRMASDETLSDHEKVGFPDAYRAGREQAILADLRAKLPALDAHGAVVIDLGAGCGELAGLLRAHCAAHGHALTFVDSPEMLAHHADGPDLTKVAGRFPHECEELLERQAGSVDALVAYSVLQYAFADASPFAFLDAALALLAPGGRLLLGDLPNASMRKRFLASAAGAAHHRAYSGRDEDPHVDFNALDAGQLDDGALVGLLLRARAAGFHAWLVPQAPELPMANRREDLLIARP